MINLYDQVNLFKYKSQLFPGWKAGQKILEAAEAAPQQSEYVHFIPDRVDKFNNWTTDLNFEGVRLTQRAVLMDGETIFMSSCKNAVLQIGAKDFEKAGA